MDPVTTLKRNLEHASDIDYSLCLICGKPETKRLTFTQPSERGISSFIDRAKERIRYHDSEYIDTHDILSHNSFNVDFGKVK